MSNSSYNEKRRDPRLENNIPLKIFQEDGDVVSETRNISRSGAYCRVNRYIEPMTKLKVQLLLPTPNTEKKKAKKIETTGVVVRTEPIEGEDFFFVAIFFSDITQRDAEVIADYVATFLEEDQSIN